MNLSFLNFCWLLRCFLLLNHVLNAWSVRCSLIVFQILWFSLSHKVKLQCLICQRLFWRYFLCVLTNAFRYFLDRLMYLHACIILSSSSTLFFLTLRMMIFRRNPLFIGWLFKNFFLLIVLLNELSIQWNMYCLLTLPGGSNWNPVEFSVNGRILIKLS